jgi:putative ABC transport system permease protein
MLYNYFTIAFRNLRRQKVFSIINILGLSVSLSVCVLIVLFVQDELSYDKFHSQADRIVLFQQNDSYSGSGGGFAPLLKKEIAQAEEVSRLVKVKPLISLEKESYYEPEFYFADENLFKVFDFTVIEGNAKEALSSPYSLLISEKMAQKYFPNQYPVGKTLNYNNKQDLVIKGILQNIPSNSHLSIDFLCSNKNADQLIGQGIDGYWDGMTLTYLLLSKGTDINKLTAQLPEIIKKTNDPNSSVWKPALIPLRDIYLKHKMDGRIKAQQAIDNVYIFSTVALFILFLAVFNYINLASARSVLRAREVGVRKVLGANRRQLIVQFLGESSFLTLIALVLALMLTFLVLPSFNQFADRNLSLSALFSPANIAIFCLAFLSLSFFNGIYPSLILSAYKPVEALKNVFMKYSGRNIFRKALVVMQFAISMGMIVATLVVLNQLYFIQHKDLGYQREQILTLSLPTDAATQKNAFKQELQSLSPVQSVSIAGSLPGQGSFGNKLVTEYVPQGKQPGFKFLNLDEIFINTFNIKLIQGRNFSANSNAGKNEFMVNRAALEYLEWGNEGVGRQIGYYTYQYQPDGTYKEEPVRGEVIGVVEDYHQSDLKSRIEPMLICYNQGWEGQVAIKLQAGNLQPTLASIEKSWKSFFPGKPFEYKFLDESFDQTYKKEVQTGQIFGLFASLAIFISCLGLFGLAAFAAQVRTKEMGIRKVLGASTTSLVLLLSGSFTRLILLAALIASPVAWYMMNQWLQNFAYSITISPWIFVGACALSLLIALITVSFQSVKAALTNPVKSLRNE